MTSQRKNRIKGFPQRYIFGHYQNGRPLSEETKRKIGDAHRGSKNASWKGGRRITSEGYVRVTLPPDHIMYSPKGTLEHRAVMAEFLEDRLEKVKLSIIGMGIRPIIFLRI